MAQLLRLARLAAVVAVRMTVAMALSAAVPFAQAPTAQEPSAKELAADHEVLGAQRLFSAWVEGQMRSRGYPGVAVGVVADQQLVWARGFDRADLERGMPMTPQNKIRMASHSKLFTAIAIMQLRDLGKLHLDDPVSKHLPWFAVKTAGADDPAITIEQLLTHGSGLPREASAHWTTLEFPTADEVRALMPQREAAFAPETRWKYSNLAYTLAGMIVEAISGQSWADYVTRHIFEPLGMHDSSVDQNVPGLAVGYGRRMPDGSRAVMPFVNSGGMAAATGITSTVEDMARFVSAQFRSGATGDGILRPASLREMHRVRMLENNWSRGNGIGFAVSRNGGKTYVGHGGSYPGYLTTTLFQLDSKVGVVVAINAQDGDVNGLATQLMNTVGEAVAKVAGKGASQIKWNPAWSRFAGLYRGSGGDSHVVELSERLVIINPEAANLDNPISLEPLGEGQFRYVAPVGGGPVGEIVQFVEEAGRVVRMIIGDSYVERVED
jgi:D-alanyl-D-alanine carboxypeptidase